MTRRPARRSRAATKAAAAPVSGLKEEERPFAHDDIIDGVDARRVKRLIDQGILNTKQVYGAIPERTFNRRLANREPLKPSEADAISRLLRITEMATRTFGQAEFARQFLSLPNPALNDRVPYQLAETDAGAREVEVVLTRIAHGVYS